MDGVPLIVGGALFTLVTFRLKAGREALAPLLSVTLILIPVVVPTSPLPGVPFNLPVEVLKLAQPGLLVMLKLRVSPTSGSLAVGVKL